MDKSAWVMPLIVIAGLVTVPAVAIAQAHLFDPGAAEAEARAEQDRTFAEELSHTGFSRGSTIGPDETEVWTAAKSIAWNLPNGEITCGAPSAPDVTRTTAVIARELTRYPKGWLARANMTRVLVCAGLREKDREIPSLPNIQGAWLIDATLGDTWIARVTHHEIYHFVDFADDGSLDKDATWSALNAPSFSYGAGGRSLRAAWASEPSPAAPGFVSAYAASALSEDKAETFALWMTQPTQVIALANGDAIVERKLRVLRSRLAAQASRKDDG